MVSGGRFKTMVNYAHSISVNFMRDLKEKEGVLFPLLERIKEDDTLMLALRGTYANVYYRGGSLLKISRRICQHIQNHGHYTVYISTKTIIEAAHHSASIFHLASPTSCTPSH